MRRVLISSCLLFAIATGAVATYIIVQDRNDTLRVVGERTHSMAGMIMAHGDAAVDSPCRSSIALAHWLRPGTCRTPIPGRAIFERLHEMVQGNSVICLPGWVLDVERHERRRQLERCA